MGVSGWAEWLYAVPSRAQERTAQEPRGVKEHALEEVNMGANLVRVGVLQGEGLSRLRDPHGCKSQEASFC